LHYSDNHIQHGGRRREALRQVVERCEKLEDKLEREFQELAVDLRKTRDPGLLKFIKSSVMTRRNTIERIMAVKSARYYFNAMADNDPAHHFRRALIDEAIRNTFHDGPPNMAFEIFRVQFKAMKLWRRLLDRARERATLEERTAIRSAQERVSPINESMSAMVRFAKRRRTAERDALGDKGAMLQKRFLQEGERRGFQLRMDRIQEAFDLMASWRQNRART
jgi:hypothetical protein